MKKKDIKKKIKYWNKQAKKLSLAFDYNIGPSTGVAVMYGQRSGKTFQMMEYLSKYLSEAKAPEISFFSEGVERFNLKGYVSPEGLLDLLHSFPKFYGYQVLKEDKGFAEWLKKQPIKYYNPNPNYYVK